MSNATLGTTETSCSAILAQSEQSASLPESLVRLGRAAAIRFFEVPLVGASPIAAAELALRGCDP
jgi:hypothetical protein